jgi:hypothetical protein
MADRFRSTFREWRFTSLNFRVAENLSTIRPNPPLKMRSLSEFPAPVKVSHRKSWLASQQQTCDGSRFLLRRCDLVRAVSICAKNIVHLALGRI